MVLSLWGTLKSYLLAVLAPVKGSTVFPEEK